MSKNQESRSELAEGDGSERSEGVSPGRKDAESEEAAELDCLKKMKAASIAKFRLAFPNGAVIEQAQFLE